jgi:hypothetical protein
VISQTAETLDEIDTLIESLRTNRSAVHHPERFITVTYRLPTVAPQVLSQPAAKVEAKPNSEKSPPAAATVESTGQTDLPNAVCAMPPQSALPASAVVGLIEEKVAPGSWSKDAKIRVVGDKLVITQTAAAHRRIERLLAELKSGDAHGAAGMGGGGGFGGGGSGGGFFAVPTR